MSGHFVRFIQVLLKVCRWWCCDGDSREWESAGGQSRQKNSSQECHPVNPLLKRLVGAISTVSAFGAFALIAVPAAAQADVVNLDSCDNATLTQPFGQWMDYDYYKLAPGGDFENAASGWSLGGGASVLSGSESFGVTGSVGSSSLSLPSGASATSSQTCVNAAYPTIRLFTRTDNPGTTVSVSVLYSTMRGPVSIPVGVVTPAGSWQPTPPMLTGSAVPGALGGGNANVSLRLTASGGTAQIDDVFVDPIRHCC
jgi:hypothetical protein